MDSQCKQIGKRPIQKKGEKMHLSQQYSFAKINKIRKLNSFDYKEKRFFEQKLLPGKKKSKQE